MRAAAKVANYNDKKGYNILRGENGSLVAKSSRYQSKQL